MRGEDMINRTRLVQKGWEATMSTSSHQLYFKNNWQCAVEHKTGEMTFFRKQKLTLTQRRNLMRGEVERGIE